MRVIAKLNTKIFIIESEGNVNGMSFINHLSNIGVEEAIYLDMGSWSEGWYRNENGKVISIGNNRSATRLQTNWLLFHN